jgi:hypothetical protein
VWAEIVTHILTLDRLLFGERYYEDFRLFGRELFEDLVKKVGWKKKKKETHEDTLLRSVAIHALGSMGDRATIEQARNI